MTAPRLLPLLIAALGVVAACDDAPASPLATAAPAVDHSTSVRPGTAESPTVEIARSRFGTQELRVAPGTTVVFVNTDAFDHTVTARDGASTVFDSGELGEGDRFEITFDEPGTYPYFCRIHPTMRATVIVG